MSYFFRFVWRKILFDEFSVDANFRDLKNSVFSEILIYKKSSFFKKCFESKIIINNDNLNEYFIKFISIFLKMNLKTKYKYYFAYVELNYLLVFHTNIIRKLLINWIFSIKKKAVLNSKNKIFISDLNRRS